MNARSDAEFTRVGQPILSIAADGRLTRAVVATFVIGGYMAIGAAFGLSADAYLLLGIPITIGFHVLVVRRPLRTMWLREECPADEDRAAQVDSRVHPYPPVSAIAWREGGSAATLPPRSTG